MATAALVLFVLLWVLVVGGITSSIDLAVERAIQAAQWGPLEAVMTATNWVGGLRQVIAGILAIGACALLSRDLRRVAAMAVSGGLGWGLDSLFKVLVGRPRPDPALVHVIDHAQGASFPSGHAFFYTWLASSVALLFSSRLPPWLREPALVVCGLLIVVGSLARVWAGAHWPSDVVGGALLGFICVAAAALAVRISLR
jgi:undecaprenyl-diphosphatase